MTESKTLADVIASVQLIDVRLVQISALARIRDANAVPDAHLVFKRLTKLLQRVQDGFLVGASMRARIVSAGKEAEEEPPVEIDVTFALQYQLEIISDVSDDVLDEFARVNGTFNAWPYWREYIQTTAARMNLPPTLLPVFRLNRVAGAEIKESLASPRSTEKSAPKRLSAPKKK